MDLGETSTIVRTPRPALDSSSRVYSNYDLIFTSTFEEWSHSWDIETIVVSDWYSISGNVNLKTTRRSQSTIIGRSLISSSRISTKWETESNLH
jgi:hypothetical protein